MKFVFTADIHLSKYGQDVIDKETGLPERLTSINKVLHQMADYCLQNEIQFFVIGGDVYHTKSIIHSMAQSILFDFIKNYPQIQFIILDGNHDLSDRGESPISALKPLRECENVLWVEHKKPVKIENVYFAPYSKQLGEYIKEGNADILISHFGLNEGKLNSGISIVSEFGMKDLQKYKLVLLGHYHKPQEITMGSTTAYYVGSPIQLDWGEKGDEKRFLVVDSQTLVVESVPTVGYKKHIEIEINSSNKNKVLKEAEKILESGDYVKLIKTDDVDLGKKVEQFNVIDKTEKDVTDRGISSTMSQDERMKRYLEIKKIPQENIESFMKIGLSIIERVEREL